MKKKYIILIFVFLNFKIFSSQENFIKNYYYMLTRPDLCGIKFYFNEKLMLAYKKEKNNFSMKNIFFLVYKKIETEIINYLVETEFEDKIVSQKVVKVKSIDKNNKDVENINFYFKNENIEKIVDISRLVKTEIEYKYDSLNRITMKLINGRKVEDVLYKDQKIIKRIFYFNDGNIKEDIYSYKSEKDYECFPCYELLSVNKNLGVFVNKKRHNELIEKNKKIVIDEYFGDYFDKKGILLLRLEYVILNNRVLNYKSYDNIIKQQNMIEYIYENFDMKNELYIYFASIVNNLRLREADDQNSKVIRLLVKGEKLEFIEQGKEETINGVKGSWVKVKTEKGEVGWCFDAYLEEVR